MFTGLPRVNDVVSTAKGCSTVVRIGVTVRNGEVVTATVILRDGQRITGQNCYYL